MEENIFEDEFLNRLTIGYGLLLAIFWLVPFDKERNVFPGVTDFISNLKWIITAPLILLIPAGIIALIIFLHAKQEKTSTTAYYSEPPRQEPVTPIAEKIELKDPVTTQPKKEEAKQPTEQEKREAERVLERLRFHQVKHARSSQEAIEASLDEF